MQDEQNHNNFVDPTAFDRAYAIFLKIIWLYEPRRKEFSGFREGVADAAEGYKSRVYNTARLRLDLGAWSRADIGTGKILDRVIHAIEIQGNNLLFWHGGHGGPAARAHLPLIEAREDMAARGEAERILYQSFIEEGDDQRLFSDMIEVVGRKYPLMAYLWFLKDIDKYLPIATTGLDNALDELKVDLQLSGRCSWENYRSFLAVQQELRGHLSRRLNGKPVRLIDAHSFSWILGFFERPDPNGGPDQRPKKFSTASTAGAMERTAHEMELCSNLGDAA